MSAKVILKPRKAKPFWLGEPWVFDGSVDRVRRSRDLQDGDVVEVLDESGKTIGRGFWNSKSLIRVRMLVLGERDVDAELIRDRLEASLALRRDLGLVGSEHTDVYRLVHAEGDGLPGLIIDRVGDLAVVQFDSLGMARFRDIVRDWLLEKGVSGVVERVSRMAREEEGVESDEGLLGGTAPDGEIEVRENGVRYLVDPVRGQKTGFYSDQRDNRRYLADLCRDRDVVDAFSYTGAFGLNALVNGGARSVQAIDSSLPALETLERNATVNGVNIDAVHGNVLRVLDHERKGDRRFGVVILDPPKLVPKRSALSKGLRLYREINEKGIACTAPGGFFATCSCSGLVSESEFKRVVEDAARVSGRELQMIHVGGQGADHPVRLPHHASRYLKFHVYRVGPEKQ